MPLIPKEQKQLILNISETWSAFYYSRICEHYYVRFDIKRKSSDTEKMIQEEIGFPMKIAVAVENFIHNIMPTKNGNGLSDCQMIEQFIKRHIVKSMSKKRDFNIKVVILNNQLINGYYCASGTKNFYKWEENHNV